MSGEGARKRSYRTLIVSIIVIAVVLVILLIPMIPVEASYNDTEPYNRLATYQVVSATLREGWDFTRGTYHTSEVVIKNTDTKDGTFTVTHKLYDVNGLYGTRTTSEYLAAGQTKTSSAQFDTQWLQDVRATYSVSAPTVIDNRVVTKHRTVYKSIIELLLYR
jgi:ABC-type Na+ efflux pump permease subunit